VLNARVSACADNGYDGHVRTLRPEEITDGMWTLEAGD